MKIASWNCNGEFRNKYKALVAEGIDIAVVAECESPEKFGDQVLKDAIAGWAWIGNNRNRGVAVISFSRFEVEIHPAYNPDFEYVLPVLFRGDSEMTLIGVWANQNKYLTYNGQLKYALKHYGNMLSGVACLAGDWNANAIWDADNGEGFSGNASILADKGFFSAYHRYFGEGFGEEIRNTFFRYKRREEGYHTEYCFISEEYNGAVSRVEVGEFDGWSVLSDHTPLVVTLNC